MKPRYKTTFKLFADDTDRAFFGSGPAHLLAAIDETRSIAKAAKKMNMAYTKAHKMLMRAEEAIGAPLVQRQTGGLGGGGSSLTPLAKQWLSAYNACYLALNKKADTLYDQHIRPLVK